MTDGWLMEYAPESGEDIGHLYLSTACYHDVHGACRLKCKFCGTPCNCPCHNGNDSHPRR